MRAQIGVDSGIACTVTMTGKIRSMSLWETVESVEGGSEAADAIGELPRVGEDDLVHILVECRDVHRDGSRFEADADRLEVTRVQGNDEAVADLVEGARHERPKIVREPRWIAGTVGDLRLRGVKGQGEAPEQTLRVGTVDREVREKPLWIDAVVINVVRVSKVALATPPEEDYETES